MLVLFRTVLSLRLSFSQLRLLVQISAEMMVLSQAKTGVINVLIEQCCHCWLPAGRHGDEAAIASALRYVHVLTEACVYGPVYRRDVRWGSGRAGRIVDLFYLFKKRKG